jgi:AcrR family transcriptional regulator
MAKKPNKPAPAHPTRERAAPAARVRRLDGELTKAQIYATSLALFRRKGFDATTMRDISKGAGLSLGAAYHYFPSKDAIIAELFRGHLTRHAELADAGYARTNDVSARLRVAFETSFDVRREDRALLGSLAGAMLGERSSSLFSPATEDLRSFSQRVFLRAVEVEEVPADAREVLATALWALHLGLLLSFVRDDSEHQARTYRILERVLNLLPTFVGLVGTPFFAPVLSELKAILAEFR